MAPDAFQFFASVWVDFIVLLQRQHAPLADEIDQSSTIRFDIP